MKITTTIQIALAAAGVTFVALSGSIMFAYDSLRDSNEQRQDLYAVVTGTAELQIRTDEYLTSFNPRPLRQWRARNSAITAALNSIDPDDVALPQAISSLKARHAEISELFLKLQQLGPPGEDYVRRMQQRLLFDRLFVMYEAQVGEAGQVRQNTLDADRKSIQRASIFSALALAMLTCIFIAAIYVVRRNLSAPLRKLVDATEAIGSGDLSHRIGEAPNNEIGVLAQAVNTMAARLQTVTDELSNTHESLRQAQKMEAIGQLTGGIAHDFNNILAGMKGNLEVMRLHLNRDRTADIGSHIDSALSLTDRAAALTHRLLAFSRQQALDPKLTNVNALSESMMPLIERTLGPHIKLTCHLDSAVWQILSDTHQLENALLNLVINSRDAMSEGGNLTIETANVVVSEDTDGLPKDMAPGQYVCLRVTDTGSGMPADVVARAFDPFFTTKPTGQGTGLGLSMIYGFIKQSEGHVCIHSAPGAGTTVELFLPRYFPASHGQDVPVAVEAALEAPLAGATRPATVLVVDDELVVRSLVAEMVREIGYHVLEAEDGASAMQLLQSNVMLDLLVTDIGLPNGMNGRQLADAARVNRPGLKVLFITGYAQNALASHDMLADGMQIMTKPFPMTGFAAKVRSMVEEAAKKLTILVVDDNEDAANNLAMLLSADGHSVRVAHDGRKGLEVATAIVPDIIFLDIGMPVMNGFETAVAIRKIPALAHTILVAFTGWATEQDRARSKMAGFHYHLTKPADLASIKALLSKYDKLASGEQSGL